MEAGKKKVTVQNMMQEKLHNARGRAAEKGVIESGFEDTLAAQSTETARITALIDAAEMKIEERALSKRLRELTEAQAALEKEEDASNKKQKEAPSDPEIIKQPPAAAGEGVGAVESITVLVDQQDGFFKKLKVDMEEVEPETPTLSEFMEHLFRFELGEGARTGLKSIDFTYRDETVVAMEVDQTEGPEETKQVDQPTQIYMECIMVKVVKQAEAADLETGKYLMELENLRALPVVGKDPKAKLFKIGGNKKTSIRGDTMMIRAVRPSVDRDDHPDWLYALPNELSSPEKPVGEVRAMEHLATNDRMRCREHSLTLDHRHPREHLKKRKEPQPWEITCSPSSISKTETNLHQYGSQQRKASKSSNRRQTKQRKTTFREPSHQCKVEKLTLYLNYLIKPNHITATVQLNRSLRANEPLIMRSDNDSNKATDPKRGYYEKSKLTVTVVEQHTPATTAQSEHIDEPEDNNSPRTTRKDRKQNKNNTYFDKMRFNGTYSLSPEGATTCINNDSGKTNRRLTVGNPRPTHRDPRRGTETGYFEKTHFTGKCTEKKQEQTTTKKHSREKGIYLRSMSIAIPTVHFTGECTACHIPCGMNRLSPGSNLYVVHSFDWVSNGQYECTCALPTVLATGSCGNFVTFSNGNTLTTFSPYSTFKIPCLPSVCVPEYPWPKKTSEAPPSIGWNDGGIKHLKILRPRPTAEETESRAADRLPNLNISVALICWVTCSQLPGSSSSLLVSTSGSPFFRYTDAPAKTLSTPVNKIGFQSGDVILLYIPQGVSCHLGIGHLPLASILSLLTSKILRLLPARAARTWTPLSGTF